MDAPDAPRFCTLSLPGGAQHTLPHGHPLAELFPDGVDAAGDPVLVARFDNRVVPLSLPVTEDAAVVPLDIRTPEGWRAYRRTLAFVLVAAAARWNPKQRVSIEHSLGTCVYCRMPGRRTVTTDVVREIEHHMGDLVLANLPIECVTLTPSQALAIFDREGSVSKRQLVQRYPGERLRVYRLDGRYDLFPGAMLPSTGYLINYALEPYAPGMILRLPEPENPAALGVPGNRRKLFRIFYEYEHWGEILRMEHVADLNRRLDKGNGIDVVRVAEALHEKKIAAIADQIANTSPLPRVILIAGPSASGKTTFSRRLAVQLRVLGLTPYTLSIDDYFRNRTETPRTEDGDYDFESLGAIDVHLFNKQLNDLAEGREVDVPRFDFIRGERRRGNPLQLTGQNPLLLVEGIHGLNDGLTPEVCPHMKWKIYVSALTQLNVDEHNSISTSDTRLIRRLVRDHRTRGYQAEDTILRWPAVRRGEEVHIFPFQEEADVMFNSALVYEGNVLKTLGEPLLKQVPRTSAAYAEASRLLDLLAFFAPMATDHVPRDSILQEFVGTPLV